MRKLFFVLLLLISNTALAATDPLPSWNNGPAKKDIIAFVGDTTTEGSKKFVKPEERVAVFDNDGTLWAEQPVYFQIAFMIDRIHTMAPDHPEWKTQQPFKAVLENDGKALNASGAKGMAELMVATHAGMTTEEFADSVADWLKTAKHPRFNQPYTTLVYEPMLELLTYLRANGYKTYIVSGGGVEFMRVFAEKVYGIPPEQVIGSSGVTSFDRKEDGTRVLTKQAQIASFNDGPAKPENINRVIGRRPIIAFGNSDGDQQMLEWTASTKGPHFMGVIHHTDASREWAYDRTSPVGKLDRALNEAQSKRWTVVDMKKDWKVVFAGIPSDANLMPAAGGANQ